MNLVHDRVTIQAADGTGDPKRWAFLMPRCGLGDHLQSLPVIYDLVTRGIEPVIYCNKQYFYLYQRLCLELHDIENTSVMRFSEFNRDRFGRFYSLDEWGIDDDRKTKGESRLNRVSLFASIFDLERPKEFDWVAALGAKKTKGGYIIYAPQSASRYRTLEKEAATYYELKKHFTNIIWYGEPQGLRKIRPLEELIQEVYNADYVLATDNGVLHLAMALGVPTFAVFGATEEYVVCEPYEYYVTGLRSYYRTPSDKECQRPCNLIPEREGGKRGFGKNDKCLTKADCMSIDPVLVTAHFLNFTNANTSRIFTTGESQGCESQRTYRIAAGDTVFG